LKPKDNDKEKPEQVREQLVTYDVYAAMPDDGNRYEIADGTLELMTSPTLTHQLISSEIQDVLKDCCKSDYIIISAPMDVILSRTEVRQPDLIMVHRSRVSILTKRGVEGAPDLVVEITSPSSRRRDKVQKSKVYAQYGIPEYWIVDLSNFTLEQYILLNESYELIDVYQGDEPVRSERVPCVTFTMDGIKSNLPVFFEE
jgi:Uma2 family endonuclease